VRASLAVGVVVVAAAALAGCGSGSEQAAGRIVFSANPPAGGPRLYVVNGDGTGLRELTTRNGDSEPAWSPDGSKVAFKRWTTRECERPWRDCARIWVVGGDGRGARAITPASWRTERPDWSPDGKRIVFVRLEDDLNPWANKADLYVMRSDGSAIRQLAETAGDDDSPAWSPDGRLIVFTSEQHGDYDIYVMQADGSGIRQITHTPAPEVSPSWSPDGKQIVFQDVDHRLVVMNADGSGRRTIGYTQAADGQPVWSPDGRRLAYLGGVDTEELYVMRSDDSETLRLELRVREPSDPDWAPLPAAG
jgi:Tol biopolymer transport system component